VGHIMGFYIKAKPNQINLIENIINSKVNQYFAKLTPEEKAERKTAYDHGYFHEYTYYIEDPATGDRYYRIENLQYDGIVYEFESIVFKNNPNLEKYDHEFVSQFIPVSKEI